MSRRSLIWVLAALLGIALTAGITWASSQLTSQRIGLSSEPISAGVRLAPAVKTTTQRVTTTRRVETKPSQTTTATRTVTTPAPAPLETVPQTSSPTTRTSEDGGGNAGGGSARGRDD